MESPDDELHDVPLCQQDLSDLEVDEIEELLLESGVELDDDHLHQIALLIKQLGTVEAALATLTEVDRRAA
jgi:hypothetical protein